MTYAASWKMSAATENYSYQNFPGGNLYSLHFLVNAILRQTSVLSSPLTTMSFKKIFAKLD